VTGPALRLFVAVSVPRHLLEELAAATEELRPQLPGGRWSPTANQHVTLKFLGWSPPHGLDGIGAAVSGVCATRAPVQTRIAGLGTFPSRRRARVLWAGVEDDDGLIGDLAAGLDEALVPLGFEPESRAFTPHLTLARWRTPISLQAPLPELPARVSERFRVTEVELFRSHLHPKGARYEVLRAYSLAAGGAQ